jgi:hypothetical protein
MSQPASSRCVANEWRSEWHVAGRGMPAAFTASFEVQILHAQFGTFQEAQAGSVHQ